MLTSFFNFFRKIADTSKVKVINLTSAKPKLENYVQLSKPDMELIEIARSLRDGSCFIGGVSLMHHTQIQDPTSAERRLITANYLKIWYRSEDDEFTVPWKEFTMGALGERGGPLGVCTGYNNIIGVVEDFLMMGIDEFTFGQMGYIDL